MNFTGNYNDNLDGEFLVCSPDNVAEELDMMCNFSIPIIGGMYFSVSLWIFYLLYVQRHTGKFLTTKSRDGSHSFPTAKVRDAAMVNAPNDVKAAGFSFVEKLLLSLGSACVGTSLTYLLHGVGTAYPTTHIRGQIGDVAFAITHAICWYSSLLLYRGAIFFKESIPQPQGTLRHIYVSTSRIPSASTVLDMAQSWFAPLIVAFLWGLLRAGVYTRGWYTFCLFVLTGLCGLRTLFAIIFQRLATLKLIAAMVYAKFGGTREEIYRRRGFVMRKTTSLVLDFCAVCVGYVLTPALTLLFGSSFNSLDYAKQIVILGALNLVILSLTCIHLHSILRQSRRRIEILETNNSTVMKYSSAMSSTSL